MLFQYKKKIFTLLIAYLLTTTILIFLFAFKRIFISIGIGLLTIVFLKNMQEGRNYIYKSIIKKKCKKKSSFILIISLLFLIIIFIIVLFFFCSKVSYFLKSIFNYLKLNSVSQLIDIIYMKLIEILFENEPGNIKYEFLKNGMNSIFEQSRFFIITTQERISEIVSILFTTLLTLPFVIYFYFKKRENYLNNFIKLFDDNEQVYIKKMIYHVFYSLYLFMTSKYIEFLSSFILFSFIFYLIDMPYYFICSFYLSSFNILIPYIGIVSGLIPIIFISYMYSYRITLYILIFVSIEKLVSSFLINYYIPQINCISSFVSLLLLLGTWKMFGFEYIFLSIPIYLIYKIIFDYVFIDNSNNKQL